MKQQSLQKSKIKVLLLEGVHQSAVDALAKAGYTNVVTYPKALPAEDLKQEIKDAHFVGIRSRTQLSEDVLDAAERLVAIGCFCIGTNQVDLEAAARQGVPVFNAPFSNTRSVAELVMAEKLFCCFEACRNAVLLHTEVNGRRPQQAPLSVVVKPSASSAMAISVCS